MSRILSTLYGRAVSWRNALYDAGILAVHRTPPAIISVGNIETGGTGKTPFVMALSGRLKERGHRCVILTRGYRGRLTGPLLVTGSHSSRDVGDEALLMAQTTRVPVIKSPDRVKGAWFAYSELGADLVILDDGFQHRRIHRDLDIVLVSRNLDGEALLPAGHLREPLSSLSRAHVIISTKENSSYALKASIEMSCFVDVSGNTHDLSRVLGKKVFAFCGIARPEGFLSGLRSLGAQVTSRVFADHYTYTAGDMRMIVREAQGSDLIITTEKDLVRIERPWIQDVKERLLSVRIALRMDSMEPILKEIETIVRNRRISRQR
ncbi:MAG: tetraacyldisaccharide 4'-kinase [Desulfomonilia bacterium]|nr:tetraacyldisaccharide 4'-kinase [Desulfomonilia bacterium]